MKKVKKRKKFRNKYGEIPEGVEVAFQVENQNMWSGATRGILQFVNGEFVIKTKRSGLVTIDKGYDAYGNTIYPINNLDVELLTL